MYNYVIIGNYYNDYWSCIGEGFIMLKFIKKSPFGFIVAAAALVLVASPEAREESRKVLVKGTAAVLNFIDQVKASSLLTTKNPQELTAPAEEYTENPAAPNSQN